MSYVIHGRVVWRYDIQLLHCCVAMRAISSGSGNDGLADFDRDCVAARLADWKPTYLARLQAYDDAVKALCVAAVAEYDEWKRARLRNVND